MQNEDFNKEIYDIMTGVKGLSFSALKEFAKSPKHFYKYKTDKKTTDAMNQGKMFHMAILEPEKFKSEYWVLDDSEKVVEIGGGNPRLTTKYKEWKAEQQKANEGRELIKKEDYDLYLAMGEYLGQCSATKDLMAGLTEKEYPFEFVQDDFLITGRIDGKRGEEYAIDLKKIADASFKKCKWAVIDMLYDRQGAIYSHATKVKAYYLIFIDGECNVTVIKLTEETLQKSFGEFSISLREFRRCAEEDLFYSSYEFYNNGFIEL